MIKLFIATSLDGYIADKNSSLDWLNDFNGSDETGYGYNDFIKSVDVIVMGRKTYEDVIRLSGTWPYNDYQTFVVTRHSSYNVHTENTSVLKSIDNEVLKLIRGSGKKDVWLAGGAEIVSQFLHLAAIDEMTISVIPVLLGDGIRLFKNSYDVRNLILEKCVNYSNGIVNLHYHF